MSRNLAEGDGVSLSLAEIQQHMGYVPKLFLAQVKVGWVLKAESALLSAIQFNPGALARAQKECMLLVLAALRNDLYWVAVHSQMLKLLGLTEQRVESILTDYREADLAPINQALLDFAVVASSGTAITESDLAPPMKHGIARAGLLEAIQTVALGQLLGTLSRGMGMEPDFAAPSLPRSQTVVESTDRHASNGVPAHFEGASEHEFEPPMTSPGAHFQTLPEIFKRQAVLPKIVAAEIEALQSCLLQDSALTRSEKERLLLATAPPEAQSPSKQFDQDTLLSNCAMWLASRDEVAAKGNFVQGLSLERQMDAAATVALASFFHELERMLGVAPFFKSWSVEARSKNLYLSGATPRLPDGQEFADDPDVTSLDRVISGDVDAFEEIVARNGQRVFRTMLGLLGNREEAQDAMQETFLRAFRRLGSFQKRSKFSTWLLTIAHNVGIELVRKRNPTESLFKPDRDEDRFRPLPGQAWAANPEQLYSRVQLKELIEGAVMRLPAKYREVLILRDIQQLGIEDTAEMLGISIPAAKARLLRGRLMLREALAPHFTSKRGGVSGVTF